MADVSAYRVCTMTFITSGNVAYHAGDVILATDPVVTQVPTYWRAVTDADMSDKRHGIHSS